MDFSIKMDFDICIEELSYGGDNKVYTCGDTVMKVDRDQVQWDYESTFRQCG